MQAREVSAVRRLARDLSARYEAAAHRAGAPAEETPHIVSDADAMRVAASFRLAAQAWSDGAATAKTFDARYRGLVLAEMCSRCHEAWQSVARAMRAARAERSAA